MLPLAEPFEKLFGVTSELRVIESLLSKEDMNFNITEIAEESDISRQAAIPVVKKFQQWDLLKVDSKHGNANYYKVNENSEIIKAFNEINKSLIKHILGGELNLELVQPPQALCIPKMSSLTATAQSWITPIGSDGMEDFWMKRDSIEISKTTVFTTPKLAIKQGENYVRASAA